MSEKHINEELNEEMEGMDSNGGSEEMEDMHFDEENIQDSDEGSELESLREEVQKQRDQYLRLFAEFDNYKKRTSKERIDIFKTANAETIKALLPVLDDFERALKEIEKSEDENLAKGVLLIRDKMTDTLRTKGLKAIEINPGDDFDVDIMDAITQIPAPSDDLKGKVVDVVETGYYLSDTVIRYAKVVTGA